jgi:hypothetical protein
MFSGSKMCSYNQLFESGNLGGHFTTCKQTECDNYIDKLHTSQIIWITNFILNCLSELTNE